MIQKAATPTVILVNKSPAFVPKALWPPMPPSAPARPPPRPRCTSTSRIRNSDVRASIDPRNKRTNVVMGTVDSETSQDVGGQSNQRVRVSHNGPAAYPSLAKRP